MIIATAAHRGEFEARLRRAGGGEADLDAAADRDAYLVLDGGGNGPRVHGR